MKPALNFWTERPVLVTGAGGFIGSHLTERLVELGAQVRAMVHYNSRNDWGNIELLDEHVTDSIEVIRGDIRDAYFCREAVKGRSIVFHLAAQVAIPYSYIAPAEFVSTNIVGTMNVLQASREFKVDRLVHTSTSEAYGTAQYTPIDEKHPLQGQSPYSASKIGADKLAESFYLSFETPVATVRPFNTFGPRQSARAVIPTIIGQLTSGADRVKLGSLEPVRDLTFVRDTVEAFILLAQNSESVGQVTNVGTGHGVSIGELAKLIIELTGTEAKLVCERARVRPTRSEVMKLVCSAEKVHRLTGWKPRYSLRDGLVETIEYVRSHSRRYKAHVYNV
jgi:NAD dependent epimerase/dehydratase